MQKPNIPPVKVIFIAGQSGAGKGTQGTMLREYLTKLGAPVETLINGDLIREFNEGEDFIARRLRDIGKQGRLTPTMHLYYVAYSRFIEIMRRSDNPLILWDGSPRRESEVVHFAEVFSALEIGAVTLYLCGVDDATCEERIIERAKVSPHRNEDPKRKVAAHYAPGNGADMLKLIATMEPSPQWPILHIPIDATGSPEEVHDRIKVTLFELQGCGALSLPVYLG